MNKFFAVICIIFVIYACSSGGSENESSSNLNRPNLNSGIDLRLGQLSNSTGAVAISAALQNGESITIFNENASDDFDAVYVAPNSQTIQVNLDETGRPSIVQFQNTIFTYTNYTKENTVDVTIQTSDTTKKARTITLKNQPIAQSILEYLNGDEFLSIILQIDQDADSQTRTLLAALVGALRFVGCGIEKLDNKLNDFIPKEFVPGICDSKLLEGIENILGFSNYKSILVNLTNNKPDCNMPIGYDQNTLCALSIWEDLVETSKLGITGNYPRNENDTGNSTGGSTGSDTNGNNTGTGTDTGKPGDQPTNTPTPTSTPTPTRTPTFTPTNTPNGNPQGFAGRWTGVYQDPMGGDPLCDGFSANFTVKATGSDIFCTVFNCTIQADIPNNIVSEFKETDLNAPQFTQLTGTVDRFGRVSVTDSTSQPGLILTFPNSSGSAGPGSMLQTNSTGSITFFISPGTTCSGTFDVIKVP